MKILVLTYLAVVQFLKRLWALPQTIRNGLSRQVERGRHQAAEAERLDRLRNPSKYLGKP